jgi:sulfite dehydrogenase
VGVAFSGGAAVKGVEVSVDNGATWLPAKMDGKTGPGRWGVFRASVKLGPGTHTVMSRATDVNGAVQPAEPSWNPSGYNYNAWHRVTWTVA